MALSPKRAKLILVLLLILSIVDVYSLDLQLEYGQVPKVNQSVVDLFNVYNYTFQTQRNQDYYSNSRFVTLAPYILGGPTGGDALPDDGNQPYSTVGGWGALYWNTESFIYFDPEASVFRTDSLLNSINSFYTLFVPPSSFALRHVGFPIPNNTVYLDFSGYSMPKLQLFSTINVLPNDTDVSNALRSPTDTGDMLFSSSRDAPWQQVNGPIVKMENSSVTFSDERLNATSIQVEEFSFDSLRLLVNTGSNSSTVLYYADAWSPNWHAYVNGTATPVIRTNIGYKSVVLPPGISVVYFVYNDQLSQIVIYGIEVLSLIAFIAVIYLFLTDVVGLSMHLRLSWHA